MKFVVSVICSASLFLSYVLYITSIPGFQTILKYQPKGKKFGNTSEVVTIFCSAISVTGLNRPYAGKDNDGNDYDYDDGDVAFMQIQSSRSVC
jgi:hypothetical protein